MIRSLMRSEAMIGITDTEERESEDRKKELLTPRS
jgi:hypothetical protein